MCRAFAITARTLLSALGVAGASVISSPADALSYEEWVMAFVRFVEWPTPAPAPESALVICQPADATAIVLELESKQVRSLTLQVKRIAQPRDIENCHVLVMLSDQEQSWAPWLNAVKTRPVLTIGSGSRFCELGGSICLLRDEATRAEKYQLNLDTLSRAGFKVSSQLLRSQPQRSQRSTRGD